MHDLVLENDVDHRTAEVMVFKFLFLGNGGRNGLVYYRYSIYNYLNSVLNIIVVSQTQKNRLQVTNKELDN